MKKREIISDEYRSFERQESRDYGVPVPPDGFSLYRLKVTQAASAGSAGAAVLMVPQPGTPYYVATSHVVTVFIPAGRVGVEIGDEIDAYWHAAGGVYIQLTGAKPSGAVLCRRYGSPIPARTNATTPGNADVKPVNFNGTAFVETGLTLNILSWVNAESADPAEDEKTYIYVWAEKHIDGYWYWTGEDCPVIDPGDPVQVIPPGQDIQANANLIVVS